MNQHQQTIQRSVTLSGTGLHTGKTATLTLLPAPPNTGIVFVRTDAENNPAIPALVENVTQTLRSTTIEANGVKVITIEHLLAALAGLQIDNLFIEIDSEEVPILNGSAQPFTEALIHAGLELQSDERTIYTLRQPFTYTDAQTGSEYTAIPNNHFSLTTLIDFKAPSVGKQYATLPHIAHFADQIAPARTFCLLSEVEMLLSQNLIKGATLENAIVYTDLQPSPQLLQKIAQYAGVEHLAVKQEGYLNNVNLHYDNEAARHKLLDVLGDLTLLGAPLCAKVFAAKPGHAANVRFTKELKKHLKTEAAAAAIPHYDPNQPPLYDVVGLQNLLPHRPPFLLIDKILSLTKQKVVGVKNITINEPFFAGHFPGHPVMPGVLIVEAMAQVGGILVMQTVPDPENHLTFFLKIENARFRKSVVPGDTVVFELNLIGSIRRGICEMTGVAYVGNKLVADAHLVAQISRRPQ
ncbi:MAG TPA: bifunctional UDP-3-O-[3-hydroxymyristoyl] N-acetylglucosamine deacetylase/3-hydroxyacyl-ACP dehydratase [Chitinophagales bacterium]|mgnify:CR=1 FL=1|nr:bifunctional UDP-3-O-[3-hydroxymyristoyl] N-acetylglucosamine deacetylase/3-hydroxyacyl-ACP dehydratase [Chitinophagales bacterium]